MRNLPIFLLLSIGILSAAELTVIVSSVSPAQASKAELWALFLSLGLTLGSWGSLLWHKIRALTLYRINPPPLASSTRQAFLFAAVLTVCLFFNSLGILSLWEAAPLAAAVVLIEFFFQAEKLPPAAPRP